MFDGDDILQGIERDHCLREIVPREEDERKRFSRRYITSEYIRRGNHAKMDLNEDRYLKEEERKGKGETFGKRLNEEFPENRIAFRSKWMFTNDMRID